MKATIFSPGEFRVRRALQQRRRAQRDPKRRQEIVRKYRNSPRGKKKAQQHWRAYYPGYRETALARHRFLRYGVTEQDFFSLLEKSGGKCGICELSMESPQVDHCHQTGKVRGLLCGSCNKALGLMRDDVSQLERAIRYLKESREG